MSASPSVQPRTRPAASAPKEVCHPEWPISRLVGQIKRTIESVGAEVKQATPPVPEEAAESVKEDVQWAKAKAQEARR